MQTLNLWFRLWVSKEVSYTYAAEAVSHKEVKSSTGLNPSGIHAAAAVLKESLTQVSTLLHFLFKEQLSKLKEAEEKTVRWCHHKSFKMTR